MSQTVVTDQGLPEDGMKADLVDDYVVSKVAEGALPFGRYVNIGTDADKQAKLPEASGDVTTVGKNVGVVLHSHAMESSLTESPRYPDKSLVSVVRKGTVYVKPEQAVSPSDSVFVRFKGKKQVQTLVFDADIVTGNTINGSVDGVAITPVPFNTSHLTTMNDLADAIEAASADVLSATVGGSGNRTITVISVAEKEADLEDFEVTGGASQAGNVITETHQMMSANDVGKFRKDADNDESAGATAAALPNAGFLTSNSAGLPVVLEIGK